MDINQPRWKTPEFTKRQINEAGIVIRSAASSQDERTAALKIIDNWRSAHAYPLLSEMEQINDQHHFLDMLRAIRTAIDHDAERVPD